MIASLQEWAIVLSGIAVFGSLCEVILPDGSFQKYIRLGMGMILVLALLSPIRDLLHQDWQMDTGNGQNRGYREAEAMDERQREEVLSLYRENLNQKMMSSIQAKHPMFSGKVQCIVDEEEENFGAIREVLISSDTKNVDAKEIQRILKEEYGITAEQITLRF